MSHDPFRPARVTARAGGLALAVTVALAVVAAVTPAQAAPTLEVRPQQAAGQADPVAGGPARVDAARGAQAHDADGSGRTGAAGPTTHKIVPDVIADSQLGTHTGRLVRELRRHGDLDRFGIQPATSEGPSTISSAHVASGPEARGAAPTAADPPVSYVTDSGRFPNGSKPDDIYEYATLQQCDDHADQAADDLGWIKNRFSYCQKHTVLLSAYECSVFPPNCRLTGVWDARNTLIGEGKVGGWVFAGEPNWRYAEFFLDVDVRRSTGVFNTPGSTLRVSMECAGTYVSPADGVDEDDACVPGPDSSTTRPPKRWRQQDTAEFALGSAALTPSRARGEQVATGEFHLEYLSRIPGYPLNSSYDSPDGGMRFDSAVYLRGNRGSVFDRAVPGFAYSLSDNDVAGVGAHIFDARTRPDTTVPQHDGKTLHGATAADPLHRLVKSKNAATKRRVRANRRVVRAFCTSPGMPPKPRDGGPFDCDEYSFASTYEGAARHRYDGDQYREHYSVRWVNAKVNQEAGRRLAAWYGTDRLLDEEDFFVPISN
jgi:hypothetical protein